MAKSNIIDVELVWMHETEKGVLVAADETTEPVWLPKSQVEIDAPGRVRGSTCTITLPEWLAADKGLI